jgi:glycosyltransferase involved in cell wall biosynthesis
VSGPVKRNDWTAVCRSKDPAPFIGVSVVIPFRGGLEHLRRTLVSLTQQCYPTDLFEILVVEDGGRESCAALVGELGCQVRIQRLRQESRGLAMASARNLGVLAATGEVILSLDFDILAPPGLVSAHASWHEQHPKLCVIGHREFVDASRLSDAEVRTWTAVPRLSRIRSVSNTGRGVEDKRLPELANLSEHPYPGHCVHGCNVSYRREQALAIGLWDTRYDGWFGYEDIDFGHRLWLAGNYIVYDPRCGVFHGENDVVGTSQRRHGRAVNYARLVTRFPELAAYRRQQGAVAP